MTNKELEQRCYDGLDDLLSIGIDLTNNNYVFKINRRITRACAQTKMSRYHEHDFSIEFNPTYIDSVDTDELYDTIIHELLHTAPKCFNHGTEWKRLADIANSKLNTNVERLYRGNDYQPWKYYVKCGECSCKMDYRVRKTQSWVEIHNGNQHRYYCPKCKSYNLLAFEI